jgi:hypothetical protein
MLLVKSSLVPEACSLLVLLSSLPCNNLFGL